MHSAYFIRRRGWMAGCLSVTRRYCIKTAKSILELFPPSGIPIILVSSDRCADTQFQGRRFHDSANFPCSSKLIFSITNWLELMKLISRVQGSNAPFSGGIKYIGWEKIGDFRAIFDENLSRKRCEIGRWLLWNVNRKS